jgi:hypothetical protein
MIVGRVVSYAAGVVSKKCSSQNFLFLSWRHTTFPCVERGVTFSLTVNQERGNYEAPYGVIPDIVRRNQEMVGASDQNASSGNVYCIIRK